MAKNKIKVIIDDSPPYLVDGACLIGHKAKKAVFIGNTIVVPFCGEEECQKIAMGKAEDIFKSQQSVVKTEKGYAKTILFLIIERFKEAIYV